MIYLTGDIHGGIDIRKLSVENLRKRGITLHKEDYVIILGDFGLPFLDEDVNNKYGEYKYWIKWLREKPCTILWIDGNHDNFDFWNRQAVSQWNGGKVQIHPDADNVIHLMRGEIYNIERKIFFAFGGAASCDKQYRKPNKTWWAQEEANEADKSNALKNLEKHGYTVDFVLSHTPPYHIMQQYYDYRCIPDMTASFLTSIAQSINYKIWFCGHVHEERIFPADRLIAIYNSVKSIETLKTDIDNPLHNA